MTLTSIVQAGTFAKRSVNKLENKIDVSVRRTRSRFVKYRAINCIRQCLQNIVSIIKQTIELFHSPHISQFKHIGSHTMTSHINTRNVNSKMLIQMHSTD
jgi:hypothetical protein